MTIPTNLRDYAYQFFIKSHIQAISGHASLNELQKYLGVTPEDKQNAVLQLSFLG
ncbi:MAG: hypothetical protein PUP91_04255 [Rhizonema sp. PD37]|nr:hypothetical protein [Rhizonema sp. PD37]